MQAPQDDITPWLGPDDVAFDVEKNKAKQAFLDILRSFGRGFLALLDKEAVKGSGFLFICVIVGSGSVAYFQLDFEPAWDRLILSFILLVLLAYLLRRLPPLRLFCLVMAAALSGTLLAKIETARIGTHFIPWEITGEITARVLEFQPQEEGGYRITVEIAALPTDDAILQVGQKLRLSARNLPEGVAIGSILQGLVRLRPPSGPVRRASYDFSFHQFYRGVSGQGFFMGAPQFVTLPPPSGIFAHAKLSIAHLRHKISARIIASIEGEAGSIAAALITGQRGGISAKTNEALRLAGLAHILAISGLHMAMVTGLVLLLCRLVLSFFTNFSSHYPPKKIAASIALIASFFYLLLSGADVAAQRSFIMMAIMLLAVLCDRAAITMRNLALAAMVTLIFMPHQIMGPSFQMSFSATAALIAAYGWWRERRGAKEQSGYLAANGPANGKGAKGTIIARYTLLPVLSTAVASLIAGTSSGIFAAFHFANTAPLGILGNAAAVPIMSIAVMPFALIATLLMPLGLEWLPLQVMGFGIEWVKKVAFFVAHISPEINPGFMTPQVLAFATLGLIILLFLHTKLRLLSLLPFLFAIVLYSQTPTPVLLISEDARLVAVMTSQGKLALSNPRPPAFILSNWLPVFNTDRHAILLPQQAGGFLCDVLSCQINLGADSALFIIAFGAEMRQQACRDGDIILLDYLGASQQDCGEEKQVITRTQLALYGTAALYEDKDGYRIEWTIGKAQRPWHRHRPFSKTAQAMP